MSEPLLQLRNLHVNFRTENGLAEVINGVDFSIDQGQTVALVGETGCGKSVTAKAVLGLLPDNADIPTGEIVFKGEDLLTVPPDKRHARRGKEMSIIMQDPMTSLNPVYTVGEQMVDVLKWQGKRRVRIGDYLSRKLSNQSNLKRQAIEMLEEVQISAPERVYGSYPVELSGGMRQRVLIAIALLLEPDLLIADEPGTALDVTTEAKILELLDRLTADEDTGVIYITHDLGVAKKISERIHVMYAGEIVEEAPTQELFEDPQHPYTRALLESIPQLAESMGSGIGGELPDYTDPPDACRFKGRCPHAEPVCGETYPFGRVTGPDHVVACHLHRGRPAHDRHASLDPDATYIGPAPWDAEGADGEEDQSTPEEIG